MSNKIDKLSSLIEQVEELKNIFSEEDERTCVFRLEDALNDLMIVREKCFLKENFNIDIKIYCTTYSGGCYYDVENMPTDVQVINWDENHCEVFNSDTQPEPGRWLIKFKYPTGAYIFGNDYCYDLFQDFFEELKSTFKYDFIDPINHTLYFYLENSKEIVDNYHEIFRKYKAKYKEYSVKAEMKKLQDRLKELEEETEND